MRQPGPSDVNGEAALGPVGDARTSCTPPCMLAPVPYRVNHADLEKLDQKGRDWYAAREVRRYLQWYRKADRPAWRARGAPLRRPSRRMPEAILEVLEHGPFELYYSINGFFVVPKRNKPRARVVPYIIRRKGNAPEVVQMRGAHRFRRPAHRDDLAEFSRVTARSERLRPLVAFYREHDGALLFAQAKQPRDLAHIQLLGLLEQRAARQLLLYDIQAWDIDDHHRVPAFVSRLDVRAELLHVLAWVGSFVFVIPLAGRLCGRVFRVTKSGASSEFASDFLKALLLLTTRVVSLAADQPLPGEPVGDPPGGDESRIAVLRLKRVRAAGK